jgi:hypothetical protein
MCRWKVKFESEALAQIALADAPNWSTPERLTNLGLYICTACGYIHIGHQPKWTKTNGPVVSGPRFEARNEIQPPPIQPVS